MDLHHAVQSYLDDLLSSVAGMKVLLLDPEICKIVSLVYSQHELLQKEVFLSDFLHNTHKRQRRNKNTTTSKGFLKAIVLCQPTDTNMKLLKSELANASFSGYHIIFTSSCCDIKLKQLADMDADSQKIVAVREIYLDYHALDEVSFSAGIQPAASACLNVPQINWQETERNAFQRCIDSVVAILLSCKTGTPCIRFQKSSNISKRIADALRERIVKENARSAGGTGIFGGGQGGCLTLIVDRRIDPVTPLLSQWTYQAMIHQFFGVRHNRLDTRQISSFQSSQLAEVTLATHDDNFFWKNRRSNYGEVCIAIKDHMERYQRKHGSVKKLSSISDMQNFVENFPKFKQQRHSVQKHVALMSACKDAIDTMDLFNVSKVEQTVACAPASQKQHFRSIMNTIESVLTHVGISTSPAAVKAACESALRLSLIYILRYPRDSSGIANIEKFLTNVEIGNFEGLPLLQRKILRMIRSYAKGYLISTGRGTGGAMSGALAKAKAIAGKARVGITGVKNVYTQHRPVIEQVIQSALTGKLSADEYPAVKGTPAKLAYCATAKTHVPTSIVIFFVGGVTYEEIGIAQDLLTERMKATLLSSTNTSEKSLNTQHGNDEDVTRKPHPVQVVMGGACVLNSTDYLQSLSTLEQRLSGDSF